MSKWADLCIKKVSYNINNVIKSVKASEDDGEQLINENEYLRYQIISLLDAKKKIITVVKNSDGKYSRGADVIKYEINGTAYIKTEKNGIEEDNLGNLPTY